MKIVQISPGTGNSFYCENCLRDSILARQMAKLGHDVVIVPMYLPLGVDWDELGQRLPMFFGGINVYLQQKSSLFNWTPRWLGRKRIDSGRVRATTHSTACSGNPSGCSSQVSRLDSSTRRSTAASDRAPFARGRRRRSAIPASRRSRTS